MFPTADSEAEDISQGTSLNRNQTLLSNERDSSESAQVAKPSNNRELTVNMLIKELVFCIALALTTYGALHNTPAKVSKVPQPVRFFYSDSVVKDWYRGQLRNALASMSSQDVSFVMYYAPWDAESQFVRGEFEKAANLLSDRVHFAAINCWNPGSECRLQHNKIPSWPILVAYTINSKGVLYKGPRNAESMVNFLELVMRPLEKISKTEDLVHLLSICDAVAVGFTPLTVSSRYYNIWYNVALKSYEFNPIGEMCFAAVTSEELASDLGVENLPNAKLMLWNDTKEYKTESNNKAWNETFLTNWVIHNFTQPVIRIFPAWKKSFNFHRYYADGNPMLILFTPLNPIYEQLPSYALLREVAMEYYTCKNNASNQWTSELIKLQQVTRLLYQKTNFLKFCQEYKINKPVKKPSRHYRKAVVSHNNKYPWINITQKTQKTGIVNFLLKQGRAISKLIERSNDDSAIWSTLGLENCGESLSQSLPAEKSFYENYEKCQSFESQMNSDVEIEQEDVESTMLPYDDDPLSAENLWLDHVKHFCRRMQFANKISPPVSPSKVSSGNLTHIHGPACDTNYTINMIAVDSLRNYHFAEALGIDIKNKKDMTAVVILDSKHESQYVLSEEYSAKSVRDFIHNFTQKRLNRTLRSFIDAKHTHYFGSVSKTVPEGKNDSAVHIIDLTTHTFEEVVRTPGMVTVVALCGGGCSALVSRALVHASRVLNACGLRVQPARVDALRHDLPWQYTTHAHPTVLVFPADRGGVAESRAFPSSERVTGSGVVALVLRSLGAPTHLRVSLALCAQPRITSEKTACLKNMRDHVTTAISRNLKYWRRIEMRELRQSLFKRLQHLHDVALHLSLFHVTDLKQNNKKQETLLQSLDRLSKNWDIDESLLRKNDIPTPITR